MLSAALGLPLDQFRPERVEEAVSRALAATGLADREQLAARIKIDCDQRRRLRRSIAVTVTGARRDPHQFELLERRLLPLVAQRPGMIRVWSAGCATGEELLDISQCLAAAGLLERAHLLGSDLLEENLEQARRLTGTLAPAVAARVRWQRHDLSADPRPAGQWSLILCRNVAIHLSPAHRERVHATLAASLCSGGVLLLGRSESIHARHGLVKIAPNSYRRVR